MCVTFYAKEGCFYCGKLEALLIEMKIPFTKTYPAASQIERLKDLTKMSTFPMVFIGNELIGGFTEFNTLSLTNGLGKKLKMYGIDLED